MEACINATCVCVIAGVFLTPVSMGVIVLRHGICSPAIVAALATQEQPAMLVSAHI